MDLAMDLAIFRVELADGRTRLARGTIAGGPARLLAEDLTLDAVLARPGGFAELVADPAAPGDLEGNHRDHRDGRDDLDGSRLLAPVQSQEVWAAGVTYLRSRQARVAESPAGTDLYTRVYQASRPELFFKSPGWRVRGPGEPIRVRADSGWDVPEPELGVVLDAALTPVAYVIGNDVSSRSIEGENALYLPQAKIYDGGCALGPALVPVGAVEPPFAIRLEIARGGRPLFAGESSTELIRRPLGDLVAYLGRELRFPHGCVLLTGTGIVPPDEVSLRPGDVVRIQIDGLGTLVNPVE
jgi:2-dehydro-3-deoxy-D-arabinonate dehydratase